MPAPAKLWGGQNPRLLWLCLVPQGPPARVHRCLLGQPTSLRLRRPAAPEGVHTGRCVQLTCSMRTRVHSTAQHTAGQGQHMVHHLHGWLHSCSSAALVINKSDAKEAKACSPYKSPCGTNQPPNPRKPQCATERY
jgi:hypothetical protein